jgi:hypothetical protein
VFVYSFVQRAGGTSSVNATVDGVSSGNQVVAC